MSRKPHPARTLVGAGRRRLWLATAAALLSCGLSGCMGFLRPIIVEDQGNVIIVLSSYAFDQDEEARTLIFLNRAGGDGTWKRLADRAGAARAAAAWQGELWLFYPSACAALSLKNDNLDSHVVRFEPGWGVQAAAVHQGDLWALGVNEAQAARSEAQLVCARRKAGASSWEAVPGGLPLGSAVTQLSAASAGERLWLLWRKRAADGQLQPETFSAFWQDGRWTPGPARDIGRTRLSTIAAPAGGGVLVATGSRPEPEWLRWFPHNSQLVLYRLDASGWSDLPATGANWRELVSVLMAPGVLARPAAESDEPARLLTLSGRSNSLAVIEAPLETTAAPGLWRETACLPVDLVSPEIALVPGLFLAALLVGAGLGMIAVRRRRLSPMAPGQPRPAPIFPRTAAWLTDNLLVGMVLYAVVAGFGLTLSLLCRDSRLIVLATGIYRLLFMVYAGVFEARWGATPGKLVFGLRLADQFGHRPSAKAALIRNLLRIVDELLIFPLPGLLLVAASRANRRLGDMLAGTTVTTAEALAEVHEDRRRKSDRFGLP